MSTNKKPNRWLDTWAYKKAKNGVASLLNSPSKLLALLEKVSHKSDGRASGPLGKTLESVKVLVRLASAYANGNYRAIAKDKLVMIVAALAYFAMPLDALPDFIAVLGLTDDVALLAWTWGAVKEEVEKFLQWEVEQDAANTKQNLDSGFEAND